MNTPNKEKLLERINNMKSICSDGRREIKELVSELIGEPLEKPSIESFEPGDMIESPDGRKGIVIVIGDKYHTVGSNDCQWVNRITRPMTYNERLKYFQEVGARVVGKVRVVIDPV